MNLTPSTGFRNVIGWREDKEPGSLARIPSRSTPEYWRKQGTEGHEQVRERGHAIQFWDGRLEKDIR